MACLQARASVLRCAVEAPTVRGSAEALGSALERLCRRISDALQEMVVGVNNRNVSFEDLLVPYLQSPT
ncbi:MAG: hypothetical protein ICV75_08235 [Nitrospiraceae bacterium]|nr:hypothetical protein [Nitrospiraceae bacterium]